jgi:hypothetical protein
MLISNLKKKNFKNTAKKLKVEKSVSWRHNHILYLAVVSVSAFCVEVIVKVLVTVAIYSLFMWDVYFQVRLAKYSELGPPLTPTPLNKKKLRR